MFWLYFFWENVKLQTRTPLYIIFASILITRKLVAHENIKKRLVDKTVWFQEAEEWRWSAGGWRARQRVEKGPVCGAACWTWGSPGHCWSHAHQMGTVTADMATLATHNTTNATQPRSTPPLIVILLCTLTQSASFLSTFTYLWPQQFTQCQAQPNLNHTL